MSRASLRVWAGGTGKHGGTQRGAAVTYEPGEWERERARLDDRRPEVERRVLEALAEGPAVVWQLAERLRLPKAQVERSLYALRELGKASNAQLGSPPVVTWQAVRP